MRTGKTAAVIGASMSGLLTAAALHEHDDEVVVLDRDDLPAEPGPRKGVPQGRQLHALLGKGLDTMDELLPGLGEELLAAGAVPFDVVRDIRFSMDARELAKAPSGIVNFGISRTLLEHHVRRRVRALPRVELREATPARGPAFAGDRVAGVETGDADDVLPADLVVDASGRGSRSLTRLREHGYPEPERTTVRADLVYVTRRYRTRPGGTDPARVVVPPRATGAAASSSTRRTGSSASSCSACWAPRRRWTTPGRRRTRPSWAARTSNASSRRESPSTSPSRCATRAANAITWNASTASPPGCSSPATRSARSTPPTARA
ncbi:hypothetical protein [Streptomyces sp. AM 3-1-1]|uniref:NAD(P)/FAD-dependent oxidoreductase n=1 Tax=Streptomyces sp. AM 3-1-1 TaxID=3028711 RepID=UPI0023B99571|nr:hypothetical protein [Streptomyces sp. AM 3-1-1]WEH29919.1 hypothetical protein P0D76_22785 [Streptomyces sp. AM 3-1-1]